MAVLGRRELVDDRGVSGPQACRFVAKYVCRCAPDGGAQQKVRRPFFSGFRARVHPS